MSPEVAAVETRAARRKREKAEQKARHEVAFAGLLGRLVEMIGELRRESGHVSDRDLSLDADQSHAWLGQILKRRSRNPSAIGLARLCEKYGYNVRWLVTGHGLKTINANDDRWRARERGIPVEPHLLRGAQATVPPPPPSTPPSAPLPPPPDSRKKPLA